MKKLRLNKGIFCIALGIILAILGGMLELKEESFLWGMSGGLIGAGVAVLWRFRYWLRPENRERYAEMEHQQRIDLHDERKIMLRDKSGRIAYQISIYLYCLLIAVSAVCVVADLFMPFTYYAVIALVLMLIFQYISGVIAYRYLDKRM